MPRLRVANGSLPNIWYRILNTSAETVPSQGILWITGHVADSKILNGAKPEYGGITLFGICPREIEANAIGRIVTAGQCLVTVTLQPGQTLETGDRVGPKGDNFTAWVDEIGPMRVDAIVVDVLGGDQPGIVMDTELTALVTITRERGDCFYIRTSDGTVTGPFYTIILEDTLTMTSPDAGEIQIGAI